MILAASSIGSAIFHGSLSGTRVDMISALARAFLVQKSSSKRGGGRFGATFAAEVVVGGSTGPDGRAATAVGGGEGDGVADLLLPLEALPLDFLFGMVSEGG